MTNRGSFLTASPPSFTSTSTGGVFKLNDAAILRAANQYPRGPEAPTSLTASAGNAQLSLSWTAPANAHGTITNYLVEYTASGGSAVTVLTNSTGTSYTLTGLTNGTAYAVRVAAVNFTAGDYSGTFTETPASGPVLVKLAGNYTGEGTQASPYSGSTVSYPLFRAAVAGTIFYSADGSNNHGDQGGESQLRINNVVVDGDSTGSTGDSLAFSGSRAVSPNDEIGLSGNNWGGPSFSIYLVQ